MGTQTNKIFVEISKKILNCQRFLLATQFLFIIAYISETLIHVPMKDEIIPKVSCLTIPHRLLRSVYRLSE
jgi:hypothetical protein